MKTFLKAFVLIFSVVGVIFFVLGFYLTAPLISTIGLAIICLQVLIYRINNLGGKAN